MLRRVFNSLLETSLQSPTGAVIYPNPFTKPETIPFGWLSTVSPCFPVNSKHIKILTEPGEFYNVLKAKCGTAQHRILLASLYLGSGKLEQSLVQSLQENPAYKNGSLKISVLIDYMRGSRLEKTSSRQMLQPLLQENRNCEVSLYHTPIFRGFLRKILPNRWNELVGLQHMKIYIFDNTLVISGANLSHDYFTNRQDRYFVIEDRNLCDFYAGLIRKVQMFSLQLDQKNEISVTEEWGQLPYEGDLNRFVQKAGDLIEDYILNWKDERNIHKEEGFDTWIFPLVQMGQLGIFQDAQTTERIISESPPHSRLKISTGYFNLTNQYMSSIINDSRAIYEILMAHPRANGFLGAKGAAGGIPYAYSLIAQKFKREYEKSHQESRISLHEYFRDAWTYHGKGLWFYPAGQEHPCLTLIGSPNFGERSVRRDLESQLVVVTENPLFRRKLHEECENLYKFGRPDEVGARQVPGWVHAFVVFCRNYF